MTVDRAGLLRRLGAAAAAGAAGGLLGGTEALAGTREDGGGSFPGHPRWKFVFLSHLTTSPWFVPVQYGIQDACDLVRCSYRWTGSARGDLSEVLDAFESAASEQAGGIAIAISDPRELDAPISRALDAGIPVVAFHLDAPLGSGNRRLAFVGQNPYAAGRRIGARLARLVAGGEVVLLAAEPDGPGVRRRLDGVVAALERSGAPLLPRVVTTSLKPFEAAAVIGELVSGKPPRALLALDPSSTEGLSEVIKKRGQGEPRVRGGAYGVLPATLKLIRDGHLDFTVDEQPYVQGFLPVLQLFLLKISGGLVAPSDVETRVRFVTRANVERYLARTRYEGSSSRHRYPIG